MVGLLYLENNLATHVFTPARMAVLQVLASEAATSLENTRLYSELREREARVRPLFYANIIGVFIWQLDGRILEANQAFGKIVGYDSDELMSGLVRWKDLMPAEWNENDDRRLEELLATGSTPPFEAEYVKKDGSRVPVLVGAALLDGKPSEGVAFVLDLTESKAAQLKLRRHEAFLAEAQRLSLTGSFGWNVADDEHFWSEETFRIFEYDPSLPVTMQRIRQRLHPEDVPLMDQARVHVADGRDLDFECRLMMPAGAVKYLHIVGRGMPDKAGRQEYIGAVQDVTKQRTSEEALGTVRSELAHVSRMTSQGLRKPPVESCATATARLR
jgi:PAS domain S-box-containing protein